MSRAANMRVTKIEDGDSRNWRNITARGHVECVDPTDSRFAKMGVVEMSFEILDDDEELGKLQHDSEFTVFFTAIGGQ